MDLVRASKFVRKIGQVLSMSIVLYNMLDLCIESKEKHYKRDYFDICVSSTIG